MKRQPTLFPELAATLPPARGCVTLYDEIFRETELAFDAAPECPTRESLFAWLLEHLPQASSNTRRINAYKIRDRYFSGDEYPPPLARWWPRLDPESRRQLLYYHLARSEQLVGGFLTDVFFPHRERELPLDVVRSYVTVKLLRADPRSAERLVRVLKKAGVAAVTERETLRALDGGPAWAAVLYLLHYEFGDGRRHALYELAASHWRRYFLVSDDRLRGWLLRGWNEHYIIYEPRRSPEGFRVVLPLARLTAGPLPAAREEAGNAGTRPEG